MSIITKAVILCGGRGTRFLPITKSLPKEMLPVIDTPVLGYIVEEAVNAGITDILIVLGKGKEAIRDYFTRDFSLERALIETGKPEYAEMLYKIGNGVRINFTVQESPLGSGHAVGLCESFTANEPFALVLGDDLIFSETPVIGQLAGAYGQCGTSIIGVQTCLTDDITKYGVADVGAADTDMRLYPCRGIVEKPSLDKLPSRLAAMGRYVLTPDIYGAIRSIKPGQNGELQLTDALTLLARNEKMSVYDFVGKRYDMGDKFGAVLATIDYASRDERFGKKFKAFLKEYVNDLAE